MASKDLNVARQEPATNPGASASGRRGKPLVVSAQAATAYVGIVALSLILVQILPVLRGEPFYDLTFLSAHLGATISIAFVVFGWDRRRTPDEPVALLDFLLALLALICSAYFAMQGARVHGRIDMVSPVFMADLVFGSILILLLLEGTRRVAGSVLSALAIGCIAFIFLGPYLPQSISHRGMSFERFIDLQLLSEMAIFGTPISASAHMVFYFIMVGAFLKASGASQLFVDTAYFFTARSYGGPAKASVISSAMFGTISGSAVANVLISGVMTIPLMVRNGVRARMAGAIEAVGSTGGQLAPPVMGAAAFIMADMLGVDYADIMIAAIAPAFLYYLSLFIVIDAYARRNGLSPDRSVSLSRFWQGVVARCHLFLPLIVMIVMLMERYSLRLTGVVTVIAIVITSLVSAHTRMGIKKIYGAMVAGVRSVIEVAIPSACAGIIVGTLVYTGMSLRLQRLLLDLAGDSLFVALAGTMFLTILFGLGMPTSAAYLVSAILVAPALQEFGVPPLAAHLFILYFGVLSMVTPPVGLASYAAAGLSGTGIWATGLSAFVLAIPGFLIPYAFVYDQGILFQGDALHIIYELGSVAIGITALAMALGGYLAGNLTSPLRVVLICSAPLVIIPGVLTDIAGIVGLTLTLLWQLYMNKSMVGAARNATG